MKRQLLKVTNVSYPSRPKFPGLHPIFRKIPADCGDKERIALYLEDKTNVPSEKFPAEEQQQQRSSRKRLASNSNQGSPNTQTVPSLTLFLPLQVHGSWLGFLQSLYWKSDTSIGYVGFFEYVGTLLWAFRVKLEKKEMGRAPPRPTSRRLRRRRRLRAVR